MDAIDLWWTTFKEAPVDICQAFLLRVDIDSSARRDVVGTVQFAAGLSLAPRSIIGRIFREGYRVIIGKSRIH